MKAKVLVVDDDGAFRQLVMDILAVGGYEVAAAESAERALEILSQVTVDLVLTDQRMQ